MPANLTPEFKKARDRFRVAQSRQDKLAALEEMLTTIPKHKGTDKMRADLTRRIAKLRNPQPQIRHGRGSSSHNIQREGAGQAVLVGPPNSGKSSLLGSLSNARPEIGEYPYSTVFPVPGMIAFEDASIQLIDLPPITSDYGDPWIYDLIRQSDLCLLVFDGRTPQHFSQEIKEILSLLEERRTLLVESKGRGPVAEIGDNNNREIPGRIVLTKGDLFDHSGLVEESSSFFTTVSTSTVTSHGLDELRKMVFAALNIVRIYTKLPGKPPDMKEPYTLALGSTVIDAVKLVHREFVDKLGYVRIWGSGKFDGQKAPSDHPLQDKDIIEIHLT